MKKLLLLILIPVIVFSQTKILVPRVVVTRGGVQTTFSSLRAAADSVSGKSGYTIVLSGVDTLLGTITFSNADSLTISGYGSKRTAGSSLVGTALILSFVDCDNLNIFGVEIDGNANNRSGTYGSGGTNQRNALTIKASSQSSIKNITLRDLYIHNSFGEAILIHDANGAYVSRCFVDSCAEAIEFANGNNGHADNNIVGRMLDQDGIEFATWTNAWCVDNYFPIADAFPGNDAIDYFKVSGGTIRGNYIQPSTSSLLTASIAVHDSCRDIRITGNTSGSILFQSKLADGNVQRNIEYDHNTIINSSSNVGFEVNTDSTMTGFLSINNNKIRSDKGLKLFGSGHGVNISNNQFINYGTTVGAGIELATDGAYKCNGVVIRGNLFDSLYTGVSIGSLVDSASFIDNHFQFCTFNWNDPYSRLRQANVFTFNNDGLSNNQQNVSYLGSVVSSGITAGTVSADSLVGNGDQIQNVLTHVDVHLSDIVTNGTFTGGGGWTQVSGSAWTFTSNKAHYDESDNAYLKQSVTAFNATYSYRLSFTISSCVDSAYITFSTGLSFIKSATFYKNGSYTFYVTGITGSEVRIAPAMIVGNAAFDIDNLSIIPITPNSGDILIADSTGGSVKWKNKRLIGAIVTDSSVIVGSGGGGGASDFSQLDGGTNTGQTMIVGNSSSLTPSGTGIIDANKLQGHSITEPQAGSIAAAYIIPIDSASAFGKMLYWNIGGSIKGVNLSNDFGLSSIGNMTIIKQPPITSDAFGIKLSGATGSPGANRLYGTNPSGVYSMMSDIFITTLNATASIETPSITLTSQAFKLLLTTDDGTINPVSIGSTNKVAIASGAETVVWDSIRNVNIAGTAAIAPSKIAGLTDSTALMQRNRDTLTWDATKTNLLLYQPVSTRTTVGNSFYTLSNPSAITFPRINADNTVTPLSAASFLSAIGGGSGTVTSVAQSFTGGLISVGGSPITSSGTLALTVAGTSGGVPYFASTSTWASSGLLTTNALMLGGGAGAAPTVLGSLGTTSTVLHGNASGAPTFGSISNSDLATTIITGLTEDTSPSLSNDFWMTYDASATSLKKVKLVNLFGQDLGVAADVVFAGLQVSPNGLSVSGVSAFTGNVILDNGSTSSGTLRIKEDSDNGSNYIDIVAPASITANQTYQVSPLPLIIPISDETTTITTGTAKVTFRMPCKATIWAVRASVNTVSSSGIPTFDINEAGTTILSTKLTIDASELTSTTAAAAAVISDAAIADDAEMTIDIDVAGTGAKGAKVVIYYFPVP